MAHSLVVTERRLVAAWGSRLSSSSEVVISGARRHAKAHVLKVLDTAAGSFRKSGIGIVVPADDAGHVWRARRVGCIGAHDESINVSLGHLIWQLREPVGLRRRRDWARLSVDEASKFFGLQVLLGVESGSGGCQRGRGQLAPHRLITKGSSSMDSMI